MLDPGGVVTTTLNSELSMIGMKPPPMNPMAGRAIAPTNEPMVSSTIANR